MILVWWFSQDCQIRQTFPSSIFPDIAMVLTWIQVFVVSILNNIFIEIKFVLHTKEWYSNLCTVISSRDFSDASYNCCNL